MEYGIPKVYARGREGESCCWAYLGLILTRDARDILVTSALLGQPETHTFYLKSETDREPINLNRTDLNSNLLLFLEIPRINKNSYSSAFNELAKRGDYRIGTTVSCVGITGKIDQIGSWLDITNETNSIVLDGKNLIRIKVDQEPHCCLVGAPVVSFDSRPSAIGVVVGQSGFHIYAQQAHELAGFGTLKVSRIVSGIPKPKSDIQEHIEAAFSELETEALL